MEEKRATCCEDCENYIYNEETEQYECEIDLDEDEYLNFLTYHVKTCPYYRPDNEYRVVHKQI